MSFTSFPCSVIFSGIDVRPAGLQVHARGPVHRHERLRDQHFAGRAVERVREAVAVEVHECLARRAA